MPASLMPLAPLRRPAARGRTHRGRNGLLLLGAAAAAAGAVAARRARPARPRQSTWYAVTVQADPAELTGPDRPDVLARLAERHDVRVTPAPGGRGAEIAVAAADGRTREEVRALKQLLETGEVLVVEGQPEGRRTMLGRAALPVFRRLARRGAR
ncbi:hypothetical protein HNP84_003273 [Thermocatellispora tengchongensis]|uniref:Uncharacterized protein n=1 Tax=Thermocatellispora tengchongensis TaxID=1073253 RepID=A0A840P8L0_9ACTN|nr:hypothetical protein [Thermocatellispora tengchongensis]MBB5133547.1 hypothetical protein [Thermocatellispora tengchongensis]